MRITEQTDKFKLKNQTKRQMDNPHKVNNAINQSRGKSGRVETDNEIKKTIHRCGCKRTSSMRSSGNRTRHTLSLFRQLTLPLLVHCYDM